MAKTLAAPRAAQDTARIPVPVPISTTLLTGNRSKRSARASRQPRVEPCRPDPKTRPGSIRMRIPSPPAALVPRGNSGNHFNEKGPHLESLRAQPAAIAHRRGCSGLAASSPAAFQATGTDPHRAHLQRKDSRKEVPARFPESRSSGFAAGRVSSLDIHRPTVSPAAPPRARHLKSNHLSDSTVSLTFSPRWSILGPTLKTGHHVAC